MPSAQSFYLFVLFTACLLLVIALYVEFHLGIAPCPLCVLQRFAFGGVAITALFAYVHHPRRFGKIIYAISCFIFCLCGIGLASRQIWLQHHPLNPNAPCLPGLSYLIQTFSLSDAIQLALRGTIDCGRVNWELFGLSMAEWALLYFILFATLMILVACVKEE